MAAEETLNVQSDSVQNVANSNYEDDVFPHKKKVAVLFSYDETDIVSPEIKMDKNVNNCNELTDLKMCEVKDVTDLLPYNSTVVTNSITETSSVKTADIEDNEQLRNIDNVHETTNDVATEPSEELTVPSNSLVAILPQTDTANTKEKTWNQTRFLDIVDSDSEDERVFNSLLKKRTSKKQVRDSQSLSNVSYYSDQTEDSKHVETDSKRLRVINSDSEDEDKTADETDPFISKKTSDNTIKESKGPSELVNPIDRTINNKNNLKLSEISTLIDSDSDDETPSTNAFRASSSEDESSAKSNVTTKKEKPGKKRTGSARAAKEEAMRGIYSETQRLLRESQVSLPYHRPRQRTLQEFLNRKKNLPVLPTTLTTAAKVKMSSELVGRVLEEKEKEAELFYKSSSDSDNEDHSQADVIISDTQLKQTVDEKQMKKIAVEDIPKAMRNDTEDCCNEKEIIKQGNEYPKVSRKLFNSPNKNEELESLTSNSGKMTSENQDCDYKYKESDQRSTHDSTSQRLFGSESNELMDIDLEPNNKEPSPNKFDKSAETQSERSIQDEKSNQLVANLDEGESQLVENDTEDFELRLYENSDDINNDKSALQSLQISENSTNKFENVIGKQFINDCEPSKLHEKNTTDLEVTFATKDLFTDDQTKSEDFHLQSVESEDISINNKSLFNNKDSENTNMPIGHVKGLPLPEFASEKSKTIKTKILPNVMKLTPKLQGSPNTVIVLSPRKDGINNLMKRFMKHSVVKNVPESSPEVTTTRTELTTNGLKIINEVLPYKMPINKKNDDPELSKPGAKLTRLKEELQQQMAIQRTKEWEQKELEIKTSEDDDIYDGELSDCGMNDMDDVEEESYDGESEPEEDDLPIKESKNKYKSPFVDNEAEVSEEDDVEEELSEEDNEEAELNEEENVKVADDSSGGDDENILEKREESEDEDTQQYKPRKLKRIMKAFEDDDSNESEVKEIDVGESENSRNRMKRTRTDVDMFTTENSDNDWLSGTEDDLPVYQQRSDNRSQACASPSIANNSLSIVSPITQLTALNTRSELINTDLNLTQNPMQLVPPLSVEKTPIGEKCYRVCDSEKREKLPKKLFDDIKGTPNDSELMDLCSGQFDENVDSGRELNKLMHTSRNRNVSDAELLDLCSGTFNTQTAYIKSLEVEGTQKIKNKDAEDVTSSLDNRPLLSFTESSEKKSQKPNVISKKHRIVFSSDDEDDVDNLQRKNAEGKSSKRNSRKLKLSDSEEESDVENLSNLDDKESDEEKFIDYDSEENEIVVPKKDIRKIASNFLDEEAELSESEWGSADEDEKDLNELDLEEGDLEDIDQDQVKKQLEKIHMRQVLDADQREVRLLQEILLEDGELHSDGASRQRKFKWKNIDELGLDGEEQLQNVDEEGSALTDPNNEAESELEWRKQRLEREKFLQEQRAKEADEKIGEEMEDSQLFQLGMRALKKNKINKIPNKDLSVIDEKQQISIGRHTVADLFVNPGSKKKTSTVQNAIHRGSFLARGEESLARLSMLTRQNNDQAIIRTKKSRNFVFAQISPAIETSVEDDMESQKNNNIIHEKSRKRKQTFSMTPELTKKSKKEYAQSARNKLFS